ncbi:MAG TPA: IclR family transcriptional regulator, partial [Syntrophorhabdus sp.]|nr:IclR family transcriptional regulator [Syntrophorhabdus sp.]
FTEELMTGDDRETFYNKSLERALQIMNAFRADRQELTIGQLAEILHLSRATVTRLCTTLVKYDYLKKNPESKKYSLGIRLFDLGSIVFDSFSLRRVASPHLSRLQMKVGKTIYLGVMDNDELLYIDKREDPRNPVSFTSRVGTRRPPYWGMLGIVLMAYLAVSEVERLLQKYPLAATTKKSITGNEEYMERLSKVRKQGYYVEIEEVFEGIGGVSAPVRDFSGKVIAGIGVGFISSSVDSKGLKRIIKEVTETAGVISREMGYVSRGS